MAISILKTFLCHYPKTRASWKVTWESKLMALKQQNLKSMQTCFIATKTCQCGRHQKFWNNQRKFKSQSHKWTYTVLVSSCGNYCTNTYPLMGISLHAHAMFYRKMADRRLVKHKKSKAKMKNSPKSLNRTCLHAVHRLQTWSGPVGSQIQLQDLHLIILSKS
jgi:hypothetical protein